MSSYTERTAELMRASGAPSEALVAGARAVTDASPDALLSPPDQELLLERLVYACAGDPRLALMYSVMMFGMSMRQLEERGTTAVEYAHRLAPGTAPHPASALHAAPVPCTTQGAPPGRPCAVTELDGRGPVEHVRRHVYTTVTEWRPVGA